MNEFEKIVCHVRTMILRSILGVFLRNARTKTGRIEREKRGEKNKVDDMRGNKRKKKQLLFWQNERTGDRND